MVPHTSPLASCSVLEDLTLSVSDIYHSFPGACSSSFSLERMSAAQLREGAPVSSIDRQ
jgi:hypothetical protein